MKLILGEMRFIEEDLRAITKKELPIKLSYKFAKLVKKLLEENNMVEQQRIKLVKKYSNGEMDVNGMYSVLPDKSKDFREEFGSLLEEEIEVDFEPIDLSELGDITIPPFNLARLSKIIKFEDEDK